MLESGAETREKSFAGGRYRPVEEDGHGPLAGPLTEVFHARDVESGREVAFKRFLPQYSGDPRFAIRFREQLRTLAGLQHPALATIVDYGLDGDAFYIASGWVDGINLGTYLAEYGAFSPASAVHVARRICAALHVLHERGIMHRGLKPENIFITSQGHVQVADAALNRLASESGLSRTTVMLGAVDYMSPEQARGRPTGPESDIYSLGVILFEMLTDRLPFMSDDAWSVVRMHAQAPPPSPRRYNAQVSPELAGIVQKTLHKSREGRYASAAALDEALAPLPQSDELLWLIPPKPAQNGSGKLGLPVDAEALRRRLQQGLQRVSEALGARLAPLLERRRRLPFGQRLLLQFVVTFVVALLLLYALTAIVSGENEASAAGASGPEGARNAVIRKAVPPEATPTLAQTAIFVEQPGPTSTATEPAAAPVEAVQQGGAPPGGSHDGGKGEHGGNGPPSHAGPPGGPPGQSGGNPGRGHGHGKGKS